MTTSTQLLLILSIMVDICIVLGIILFTVYYFSSKENSQNQYTIMSLLQSVKLREDIRRQQLRKLLGSGLHINKDILDGKINELIYMEHNFYKNLISIYIKNNSDKVANLYLELREFLDKYYALDPKDLTSPAEVPLKFEPVREAEAEAEEEEEAEEQEQQVEDKVTENKDDEVDELIDPKEFQARFITYLEVKGLNRAEVRSLVMEKDEGID